MLKRRRINDLRYLVFYTTIILLISSIIIPLHYFDSVNAKSLFEQETEEDFKNGIFNETEVIQDNGTSKIVLKTDFIYKWEEMNPITKPGYATYAELTAVYGTDKVIRYGGITSGEDETWEYDLSDDQWTKMNPKNNPGKRSCHRLENFYETDKILMFAGIGLKDDTWIYDLSDNNWTTKVYSPRPSFRYSYCLSQIHGTDKIMLFGGEYIASVQHNDTWIFDLSEDNWTKMNPKLRPPKNRDDMVSPIEGTDKVLLFRANYRFNETWIYDLSEDNWTKLDLDLQPEPRRAASIASISGTDKVVLFSGWNKTVNGDYIPVNNTWIFDYSELKWTNVTNDYKPLGRYPDCMASIFGHDKALLWGCGTDTWVFSLTGISEKGDYESEPIDLGCNSSLKQLIWNCSMPAGTDVKFRLRSACNESGLASKEYLGTDGKNWSYYTGSPSDIWPGHRGDRWVQYIVYFSTDDFDITPELKNVILVYSNIPTTKLTSPEDCCIQSLNAPIFKWSFIDPDSPTQAGFQVVIDNHSDFGDIDFDSGKQDSILTEWDFPSGTGYTEIPDGTWYWKVRTRDPDGEWSAFSPYRTFYLDTINPTSTINFPLNNTIHNTLLIINGTASDTINGLGLKEVRTSIEQLPENKFWSGAGWSSSRTWLVANGTDFWTFNASSVLWATDRHYVIHSSALDLADNPETLGIGKTVFIDNKPPEISVTINDGQVYTNTPDVLLNLTAVDTGCGMGQSSFSSDGVTWDDWDSFIHTKPYSLPTGDGEKTVYYRARDKVGNTADPVSDTIILDTTPPENLSVVINNGACCTRFYNISLSLDAVDALSGLKDMAFGFNGIDWTDWVKFDTKHTFSFPSTMEDGEKILYFMVRDVAGNTAMVHETILLDTTPPRKLSIDINTGDEKTNSTKVLLKLDAIDDVSGVMYHSLSTDNKTWSDWEIYTKALFYNLSSGDGEKTIYLRLMDRAGNIAEPVYDSIILDTSTEQEPGNGNGNEKPDDKKETGDKSADSNFEFILILIIIVIVIVLVITMLILKRKKGEKDTSQPTLEVPDAEGIPEQPSTEAGTPAAPQPVAQADAPVVEPVAAPQPVQPTDASPESEIPAEQRDEIPPEDDAAQEPQPEPVEVQKSGESDTEQTVSEDRPTP